MKYHNFILYFTLLGIISILSLQYVWLHNTYILIRNNIFIECNNIIEEALNKETSIIAKQLPEGTRIIGGANTDSIPQSTYLYEGISKLGYELSLQRIDSITNILLKEKNINNSFYIRIINPKNKEIYDSYNKYNLRSSLFSIESKAIPIKADLSKGIQLVLENPQISIFERMDILLISTIFFMIFVIGSIMYQVRIISKNNKISQIREDFSYAMVHDMKTPLSTIMMVQDMLKSGRLEGKPEIKNKYMNIAESETEHLFALTNKILTISKLENHKLEMNKTEIELKPIIDKLTEKFKAKAQKPVNFIISLQAKTAYADNDYLGEVISNLIDNAIKYSKESVEINITAEESERYTILKVRDNGLGISEADQKVIFQKYERAAAAKRSRRNGASGFGLGLNFVDQVIKAHEGKIFVNSTEGEFTEFTIYLPLDTPNNRHNR